jgi:hypothetical protein
MDEARVGNHRRDASASLRGWLVGADRIEVNESESVRRGWGLRRRGVIGLTTSDTASGEDQDLVQAAFTRRKKKFDRSTPSGSRADGTRHRW